uniref:LIM homeobox transcription factor 1, alpha n=1 Tax=Sphaeramia orbicularis TaxID=375764 RepID=A0A673A0S8_9TELE
TDRRINSQYIGLQRGPRALRGNFDGLHMDQRAVCTGCHRLIRDRFLLRVTDGLWHEECVRCAACGDALRNSCFLRDRKLYCKRDYAQLFAVRCGGCGEAISPAEMVMHAGAAVFHLRCFTCSVCSCRLQTGDRCVLREGQLLCAREDYHQCKSDDEEDEEEEPERVTGRRIRSEDLENKRPKRPRTILTTQQRRTFKASFEVSSKPSVFSTEVYVQVWKCNSKTPMKKLARRQQQQQEQQPTPYSVLLCTTVPSCGGLTSDMERLASACSHIQQQQQMGLTTLEQQDYDMDPFRQGLTPPQMPGDHMHPYGKHLGNAFNSGDKDYEFQSCYFKLKLIPVSFSCVEKQRIVNSAGNPTERLTGIHSF